MIVRNMPAQQMVDPNPRAPGRSLPKPSGLTLAEMQRESRATAVEKGWHEGDAAPPSEAVREIALDGLDLLDLRAKIEATRNGGRVEYPADVSLTGLDAKQVRALCRLALVATEVAEAMDDVIAGRWTMTCGEGGKPEGLPSELADILIRVGDEAEGWGVDLEEAVRVKMAYNKTRSHRHGGKKA